jgi:hypothetical protein
MLIDQCEEGCPRARDPTTRVPRLTEIPAEDAAIRAADHRHRFSDMEALPVELVGVILSHVDELTLPCCYAVSHRWTTALRHSPAEPQQPAALVGKKTTIVGGLLVRAGLQY